MRLIAVFFTITCLLGTGGVVSGADGPMLMPQAEGVYRTMVGDFEVIVLSDGAGQVPVEQRLQLLYGDKEKMKDVLMAANPDGQLKTTVNAYLINTGAKLVLVDAGYGGMGNANMGKVIDNLRAAGYQPESINEIYLTHMHLDHIGGLVAGAERAFPNATVYADQREADHWLNDSKPNAAKTAITPYIDAGKFKTFDGGARLLPGIRSEPLYGHTPGHTAYVIESKGQTLVLWGDIVHVAAVQFADPAVTISYDTDKAEAAKTRQWILAAAAKNGWLIGGAHLAFPSLGKVQANNDNGYILAPVTDPAAK